MMATCPDCQQALGRVSPRRWWVRWCGTCGEWIPTVTVAGVIDGEPVIVEESV